MEIKDAKSGALILKEICSISSTEGTWVDFFWADAARNNEAHRAILFYFPISDKNLLIYSFAWDDETSLADLNK